MMLKELLKLATTKPQYEFDRDEARIKEVIAKGFEVIESTPTTLLLDLDDAAGELRFAEMLPMVVEKFPMSKMVSWPSKSGVGRHVVLHLWSELDVGQRGGPPGSPGGATPSARPWRSCDSPIRSGRSRVSCSSHPGPSRSSRTCWVRSSADV